MKPSKMNPKKIVVLILLLPLSAFVLFLLLLWMFDLSHAWTAKKIIDPKASQYIAQTYPGNDFDLQKAYHSFKDNCYYVEVQSRSSQDTYFRLCYDDTTHRMTKDSYATQVLSGSNTATRIAKDYAALVQDCLNGIDGFQSLSTGFSIRGEGNGLTKDMLVLDQSYDAAAMGSDCGTIRISFLSSYCNIQQATKFLIEIDAKLTESGIGYNLIDLTITCDYSDVSPSAFHIYDIRKEDITCEDPLEHLQALWDEQEANRQKVKARWNSK